MKYNFRYIARIVIEAETPIAIGSGNNNISLDRPVTKDANGIPYIPGTSLAGVLRHAIYANVEDKGKNKDIIKNLNDIFGFQDDKHQENSLGSRLILSSARLMGKERKVFDGLLLISMNEDNYKFISNYRELPVREHARLSHKGVADVEHKGKFDEEVLYKGSRFIFEMEMKGTDKSEVEDNEIWGQLLNVFCHPDFRIGGGSNRGFGQIRIVGINHIELDLSDSAQQNTYLSHSSNLNSKFDGKPYRINKTLSNYTHYQLDMIPEDFYLFSSGLKSDDADMNPVMEQIIKWDKNDNPAFSEELVLIPGTSIKGAISHRVAYHYNKLTGNFADKLAEEGKSLSDYVGENNEAVKALFGTASDYSSQNPGQKGVVRFSDIYQEDVQYKKLDHVAIDRFTGGPIDGALFNENVVQNITDENNQFILDFWVQPDFMDKYKSGNSGLEKDDFILTAFEKTLTDICSESLSLGGGTMRGNGIFSGTLKIEKNGKYETLYPNKQP